MLAVGNPFDVGLRSPGCHASGPGLPLFASVLRRRARGRPTPRLLVAGLVVSVALTACGAPTATPPASSTVEHPSPTASGATVQASGPAATAGSPLTLSGPVQVQPVAGMGEATAEYISYAARVLGTLSTDVATLRADLARSDISSARRDWLAAQVDWEGVGASYDSFGPLGIAVDGLPDGLPEGVNDPDFTGLHRLEYGLWHGQSAATLLPVAERLTTDVSAVAEHLSDSDLAGNPANLALRVHEILEDALRDHLSGIDDEGAGAAYAETSADVDATRAVLGMVAPLVESHIPGLVETATQQMDLLDAALQAAKQSGQWLPPAATPLAARQKIDAAIGQLLETLAVLPDLLVEND